MNKAIRRVVAPLGALVVLVFCTAGACSNAAKGCSSETTIVRFDAGDTVWGIAGKIPGADNYDRQDLVALVEKLNGITNDTAVQPGALEVPATCRPSDSP